MGGGGGVGSLRRFLKERGRNFEFCRGRIVVFGRVFFRFFFIFILGRL